MLFNSLYFALFLIVVIILYWSIGIHKIKQQNALLLVASYFFYSCWDWRFLFLLMFSTFLDYFTGLRMSCAKSQNNKRTWLWLSLLINIGFLGLFKYFNFFSDSLSTLLSNFGLQVRPFTLNLILPLGISFYTFHGISYVLDIYNNKIKAERNFIDYAVFVSFFPLLIAGPIERATHLLPQIKKQRVFSYEKTINGLRQILWGLFKKIVVADSCAEFANLIFDNSSNYSGSVLLIGAFFFTIQVYCDFSGYSDIALGTARLFGIELLKNFAFPFFSRDISEFWRRWHISLTSWFRDYLYFPLGGNRGSKAKTIRNTIIIFLISGFWHGANWTYIAMGTYFAILFLPLIILNKNRKYINIVAEGHFLPNLKELFQMLTTFTLVIFGLILFRANNIGHAWSYFSEIISPSFFTIPVFQGSGKAGLILLIVAFFMIVEWLGREQEYALENFGLKWKWQFRYAFYYALVIALFWFGGKEQQFIYFQF